MSYPSLKTQTEHVLSTLLVLCALPLTAQAYDNLKQILDRGYIRFALASEIPYGYTNLDGKAKGFGSEVAQAVLPVMGIRLIR